jgi:hypothetical protein
MGPLKVYDVTIRGSVTRMKLNDADAESYGDAAKLIGDTNTPEIRPAGPDDESVVMDNGDGGTYTNLPDGEQGGEPVSAKRRTVANKTRSAENKGTDQQ